jgi:hypothetical protein
MKPSVFSEELKTRDACLVALGHRIRENLQERARYVTQCNAGFITGQCLFLKADGFMWLFFKKRYRPPLPKPVRPMLDRSEQASERRFSTLQKKTAT